jgi:hypothetical protein
MFTLQLYLLQKRFPKVIQIEAFVLRTPVNGGTESDKSIGTTFLHVIAFVVPIQETRPVNSCKMSEHTKFKQNNGSDHLFYVIDSDLFIVYCVACFRLLKFRGQFVQ